MTKKILAIAISTVLVGLTTWRVVTFERLVTVESGIHLVMGTFTRIVVVAPDEASGQAGIKAALAAQTRVDELMSYQREDSELARINAQAGDHPVSITQDTMTVLLEARRISQTTAGAFDISVAPLIDLWKQAADTNTPPTDTQIAEAKSRVDWTQIILDPNAQTVTFGKPGMKLDLGGMSFGSGVSDQQGTVPRYGETLVTVPVTVPVTSILRQVLALSERRDDHRIQYRLRGRLGGLGLGGGFDSHGDLVLPGPNGLRRR